MTILSKIFKKVTQKNNCNKGLVPILLAVVTTGIFMPTLAIVYDLAQMRLYKTDITNIAQLAALSCVPHADNRFNIASCRNTIRNIISINLYNTVTTGGDDNQDARGRASGRFPGGGGDPTHPIPAAAFKKYFARPYSADTLSTTLNNVDINETPDGKTFRIVSYATYKPTFLKFGEWGEKGIKIEGDPVYLSASYICQNGKCDQLSKAFEEQKAIERGERAQKQPPQTPSQSNESGRYDGYRK